MKYLKKVSYNDICGQSGERKFHHYEDIASRFKEFELFLTQDDLEALQDDQNECRKKMTDALKKNGAEIVAVHCPESIFKTQIEKEGERSGNYLSLCEFMRDDRSLELFKDVLVLSDKICQEQTSGIILEEDEEEQGARNKEKEIIVVIHEGCEKGCQSEEVEKGVYCQTLNPQIVVERVEEAITGITLNSKIKVAVENITPFYCDYINTENIGKNCGWKKENQLCNAGFFGDVNKELKRKNVEFGACIDFCHIMISAFLSEREKKKAKAIQKYFEQIDYFDNVFLYHVSNYGKNLSHGQLFSFEEEEDREALEVIRTLCNQHSAPITFEMADGADPDKAMLNYEHIMFYFSNKHMFGTFHDLLKEECNKELKVFFDDLFFIYTVDKESVYEITNALWRVKQTILNNTFVLEKDERIYGVDFDESALNLSLARVKAYVYYTRFCNLGNFLADNYYSEDKSIFTNEEKAEDFGLAMRYFIFNDKIHQCVYTGIKYRFLIDFLPKKESFVRFNDGIENIKEMTFEESISADRIKQVVKHMLNHINGSYNSNGGPFFYSVGKNFGQCLFKYFNPDNKTEWDVQLFENQPINYVRYDKRKYSIQAFIQKLLSDETTKTDSVNWSISIDLSRFAHERNGSDTDSLAGFFMTILGHDANISYSKVGSVSDGEILFQHMPQQMSGSPYTLNEVEGAVLKKIIVTMPREKAKLKKITFTPDENEKDGQNEGIIKEIESINNDMGKLREIIEFVTDNNLRFNSQNNLEELDPFEGDHKSYYERVKGRINIEWEKVQGNGQ